MKKNEIFFPLFSLLLLRVFVVFCPLRVRWLLTCPFLEQKRVHTYWTVEHSCDISLSLFPIIYLVAKDTILYLLSLFDERREQKKLSRRMVFVVERNEEVVLLRARAPESIRVYWKK